MGENYELISSTGYWGEIPVEDEENGVNINEIFVPKPAQSEKPKLHVQHVSKQPSKESSSKQNLMSVLPPLDGHGQNLLLHSIELKHHIRKMMLMKMAAQHHQVGATNDNLPQLPAAPPPPKKYCSKNGIFVRPASRGLMSKPTEIDMKSLFITGRGVIPIELDNDSLKCLTYKAIAAICSHCGYENAHELTLDVLSDVLADFLRKLSKLMRVAMDAEASQRESRFPSVLEYALQETGIGGLHSLWQYWTTNILDYALKLQQEDQRLMSDYDKLTFSREHLPT